VKKPKWLLHDFIVAVHNMVLAEHGGPAGIRDLKMLEAALARPLNKNAYEPKGSVYDLAAAYSFGIAMDLPFVDGNKRTALVAGLVFLEINGCNFTAPEAETASVFEALAAGRMTEVELSRWFQEQAEA
jgi:death-on-curing protein